MPTFKFTVPVLVTLEVSVDAADAYTAEAEALLRAARLEARTFRLSADGVRLRVHQSPYGPAVREGGANDLG